jgi:hypothetical protein
MFPSVVSTFALDLCSNSMVVFTAWGPDGKPFGGSTMSFFDQSNSLKRGKQKLIFYFDRRGDNHIRSETLGELYDRFVPRSTDH